MSTRKNQNQSTVSLNISYWKKITSTIISLGILLGSSIVLYAQSGVAINSNTPQSTLDVNGDLSLRMSGITLTNPMNHNIITGDYTFLRITGPTNNFTITGIAGGVDGKIVILYNATNEEMSLNHQAPQSLAQNRIRCADNKSEKKVKRYGSVTLAYSAIDQRWTIISVYEE